MPDILSRGKTADSIKRVRQNTSYNCGPAVLEMLLSHFGIEVDQDTIVEVSGVSSKIKDYGMTVTELARAIAVVAPEMSFWYKTNSSIGELQDIVRNFNYPVGVNWQGIFEKEDYEEEFDGSFTDDDEGHFSVVVDVDTRNNYIKVADPYGSYAGNDRILSIVEFEKRWWDEDMEMDPVSGKRRIVFYNMTMFLVLPANIDFPVELGMTRI